MDCISNIVFKDGEEVIDITSDANDAQNVDDVITIYEGKEFISLDEAYSTYNSYAKMKGFWIRSCSTHKSATTGELSRKLYTCEKEGKKIVKPNVAKPRAEIRENCIARMVVKFKDNKWYVDLFKDDIHIQWLLLQKCHLRSHKVMSKISKKMINGFHDCGLGPSKIAKVLSHNEVGMENQDVTPIEVEYQLAKKRKNNVGQQCWKAYEYFRKKVESEIGFFFRMEVDINGKVRNVFWADSRSRLAFKQFGDVVVFGVTYNTNKFKMPFAPFRGVNHHRQSCLFGYALLADETTETFNWLFKTWKECMWDLQPKCIITDMDGHIRDAISDVLPETKYKFCSWHIGKNALNHLNYLQKLFPDFEHDYNKWVYGQTIEECDYHWKVLIEKYDVLQNSWIVGMHAVRDQWISAYLRSYFLAGMTSSQRSESINAFFDGYVNAQTPINEFVHQYDLALRTRRREESSEDHKTLHMKPTLHLGMPLEKHARSICTRKIFLLFEEEYKKCFSCKLVEFCHDGFRRKFEVTSREVSERVQIVTYEEESNINMLCTCRKFEGEGIFCRHILRMMFDLNMDEIPSKYVLFRWTIKARFTSTSPTSTSVNGSEALNMSHPLLFPFQSIIIKISNWGCESRQHMEIANSLLNKVLAKLESSDIEIMMANLEVDEDEQVHCSKGQHDETMILDPDIEVHKGRPKAVKHKQFAIEVGRKRHTQGSQQSHGTQQRHCGNCNELGHYKSTCPNR